MKHPKYIYKLKVNGIQNEVRCDDLKAINAFVRDSVDVLEAFEIPYVCERSVYDTKKKKYIIDVFVRSEDDYLPF